MILSPSPLSLLCALLLCFPLAIIVTLNTPITPAAISSASRRSAGGGGGNYPLPKGPSYANYPMPKGGVNEAKYRVGSDSTRVSPPLEVRRQPLLQQLPPPKAEQASFRITGRGRPGPRPVMKPTPPPKVEQIKPGDAEDDSRLRITGRVKPDPRPAKKPTTVEPMKPDDAEDDSRIRIPGRVFPNSIPPPPPKVVHIEPDDAVDESLLRRAGRVNPDPIPVTKPKKLAFMFLTTTPLPFAPLWELFFNATPKNLYNIYVHADPTFNYTPPFRGVFAGRVIRSKPTRRNSPTLAAGGRRLLAEALLHDGSNYMFALLSPLCIPLHSFKFTYKTVINSNLSFIEILGREPWAHDRWAARGEDAMLPEVKFEDFRIGSQFYILTRKHARIVVRDRKLWSKFKLPCLEADTCYPEENYFPTLLNTVDPQRCANATLTHVDWRGSHGGHPRTYQPCEVGPELIKALRNDRPRYGDEEMNGSDPSLTERRDPFLFARKFSPASIEPLMNMAKDVILKD